MNTNKFVNDIRIQNDFRDVLLNLDRVSLIELLKRAELLNRVDTKYVINTETLSRVLKGLECDYRVLQIGGRRNFKYRSCYYDDDNVCYFDHHTGKRKRFKVRTRHYIDSDEMWFEVKLKGGKGETKKSRMRCDDFIYDSINGELLYLLNSEYSTIYKRSFNYHLTPSMIVSYRRSTLLCNSKQERVTVDTDLVFYDPRKPDAVRSMDSTMAIVEVKSDGKKGSLEKALFSVGCKQEKNLSKYCLGLAILKPWLKRNNFLPTLKKYEKQGFLARSW